ncbi:hypothetical protein CL634_09540 [bacterium]|nr:hypothetical protein [bacterium]
MPRNNQDRLESKPEGGSEAPLQETNSLLNYVQPTEFVDLPTKGKFYSQEHPLHNVDTIEIKYMTAKETDLLTSKTLLKKGLAIDRMLQSIIVDRSIKVQELFLGDKNAILMAARISGFGAQYSANVTCRGCSTASEQHFDLSEVHVKEADDDIEFTEDGTFFIDLPKTEVKAECKLLTGKDESKLLAKAKKKEKLKLGESLLTDQLKLVIVSLNGETERSTVENFVDTMPAIDANHLRIEYEKIKPDVDLSYELECDGCDVVSNVSIPFSTNFLWPDR